MKTIKFTILILVALSLQITMAYSQGISINDDGSNANASAMLDVNSTAGNQGFLMPRLTEVQKNSISIPATSLLIYQTDGDSGFYFYNGTTWEALSKGFTKYSLVATAESSGGSDNDLCYVIETETFYRYEASGATQTDDNKYILSTSDGGNTRWLGISGKYNLGNIELDEIVHIDATSGTAAITNLNKIYYIAAAATTTTITIPDAATSNEGWFLRLYKESGNGIINIQTTSGQNVDGDNPAQIMNIGKGFFIKSDNATEWLKIQDSRVQIPIVISTTTDYDGDSQDFNFKFMTANTASNDITITFPSTISTAPEGNNRMFFNTGTGLLFINTNGNTIDGQTATRVISPKGYLELQKIDGEIRIIREKNLTIQKNVNDITNLECWLDASVLSGTNGSTVSSWVDLAKGTTFTASSGAEPILYTNAQNGKNVVKFDGINDVMSAGNIQLHNNTRGLTMIAVVRANNSKRMAIMSKYKTSPNGREFAFGNRDNFLFEDLDWSSYTGSLMYLGLDQFEIVEFVWVPGQAIELYINGVLQSTGNDIVNDITSGAANLKLGCGDYTSVGFWDGDFAEIMVYSEAVSSTERSLLRDNLAMKWDIDEIIIANGGGKYWQRNNDTNTITPDVDNDNLDIGTGTFTGNMNVTELFNAPTSATPPTTPQPGTIYYDTDDNKLKVWNGSIWENLN